jgi:tRNA-dihydrouridine synthase
MKIYSAPLEGITGHIFRSCQCRHFGYVDRYFTPFIVPNNKGVLNTKVLRDILPENNVNQVLIPQILTDSAEGFLLMCKSLAEYGYDEFNLNLGCPSGTVVSKGRGSGFLAHTDKLNAFLDEIFKSDYKISVKTRIGVENPDEFYKLLEIYNQYPLTELIVHPRTRKDMYNNHPNMDMYRFAVENSKNKLCYNGDIFDAEDYTRFTADFPETEIVMLGRGIIINPSLPREIKTGQKATKEELRDFYTDVYNGYREILSGSTPVMYKMKELLLYMSSNFEDCEKIMKKIKKAKKIEEFNFQVGELFKN